MDGDRNRCGPLLRRPALIVHSSFLPEWGCPLARSLFCVQGALASEFKDMYRRVASASVHEAMQFAAQGLFSTITEVKVFVLDGNRLSQPRRRQQPPRDSGGLEGSDVTLILAQTQMGKNAGDVGSDGADGSVGRVSKCSGAPSWVCFAPEIDCCSLLKGSMGWADAFED